MDCQQSHSPLEQPDAVVKALTTSQTASEATAVGHSDNEACSGKPSRGTRASAAKVAMVVQQLLEGKKNRTSKVASASSSRASVASTNSSTTSEREPSPAPSSEKRPRRMPIRKGIDWKVGARLEAADSASGQWYTAKIVAVDEVDAQIMIHFDGWSKKYDQWIPCESDTLRPCKKPDKKDKSSDKKNKMKVGEEVLARWSDAKMYPGKIVNINNDGTCFVLFYDGYRKKVKLVNVSKLPADYDGVKVPPPTSPTPTIASTLSQESTASAVPSSGSSAFGIVARKEFTVREDHNEFKCQVCGKGFRKDSLLQQHVKHYHKEEKLSEKDSSAKEMSEESEQLNDKVLEEQPNQDPEIQEETTENQRKQPQQQLVKSQPKKSQKSFSKSDRKKMLVKLPPLNIVKKEVKEVNKPKAKEMDESSEDIKLEDLKNEESEDLTPKQKRKYMRKSVPTIALRKSQRAERISMGLSSTPIPYVPPVIEEKPVPNTKLPFWDARLMAEIHESEPEELVNCMCDLKEESGLMVQCEVCQFWQHGQCMNFETEDQVPDAYVCFACKNPRLVRPTKKYDYSINAFLKKGILPNVTTSANNSTTTSANLAALSSLLAATLDVDEVLVALQHKINLTASGNKNPEDILDTLKTGSMELVDWTLNTEDSSQSTIIDTEDTTSQIIANQELIQSQLEAIERQVKALEEQSGINCDDSDASLKDEIKLILKDLQTSQIIAELQSES